MPCRLGRALPIIISTLTINSNYILNQLGWNSPQAALKFLIMFKSNLDRSLVKQPPPQVMALS
jgi:hypothetical protein